MEGIHVRDDKKTLLGNQDHFINNFNGYIRTVT